LNRIVVRSLEREDNGEQTIRGSKINSKKKGDKGGRGKEGPGLT